MISTFPSPILSVAADVVKDLEGEDALCSLWALFTKCKESLKDGRRLENISWRLWYRELAAAHCTPSSSPGSLSPPFSEKRSPSPITPVSEDGHLSQEVLVPHPSLTPVSAIETAHSWHAQNSANIVVSAGRRLSTASAPMERRKSHSSIGVGKMILDILPAKFDVNSEKEKAARPPTRPAITTAATITASVPHIAQPRPLVAVLPMVQLPATPPQPERASFPRVVVVNPTPHPTPPATPSVPHPPTAAAQPSSHLLPPPPARSLISATAPRHLTSRPRTPPSPSRPAKQAVPKSGSPPRQSAVGPSSTSCSLTSKQPTSSSPPAASHDAIPSRCGGTADPKPNPRLRPSKYDDETLKASDRRFFLQDGGSPSPERPHAATATAAAVTTSDLDDLLQSPAPSPTAEHEHGPEAEAKAEEDPGNLSFEKPEHEPDHQEQAPDPSPSSAASSQLKSPSELTGHMGAAGGGGGGAGGKRARVVQVRKNKDRHTHAHAHAHVPARPALQRLHPHALRTTSQKKGPGQGQGHERQPSHTAEAKKTTFNIGSVSSNGSGSGGGGGKLSKVAEKEKEKEKEQATEKVKGKEKEKKEGEKEKGERRREASSSKTRRTSSPAPNPPKKSASTPHIPANANASVAMTTTAAATTTTKANGAGPSQPRRGIVISTSSEYETTDTDDESEWASEDSGEDKNKDKARKAKAAEDARLREAAEEAQRQRDMFAKVPKRSYSNLGRVQSGLLSQLLNPDPNLFPPNHPYRTTRSQQDVTQLVRPTSALQMQMRKSAAAVPLAAQVQVTAQAPATTGAPENGRQGGYRPKGRPEAEMEFSSDDEENPDDTIQVSRSLAQQRLAELANPNRRRHSDRQLPQLQMQAEGDRDRRAQLPTVATAPIPLSHPYNLPAPAPPMTPRATRRQMLQTELSESLRRNLLWERQVSRMNMTGRRAGNGVLGNGLRPLTAVNGEPGAQQQQAPDDKEEKRRRAMARNKSWADEYHHSGW